MTTSKYDQRISHKCTRQTDSQGKEVRVEPNTNYKILAMADLIKEKVIGRNTSFRDRAMFAFLAAVGCRVSELNSIKKRDVWFDEEEGEKFLYVNITTLKNKVQKKRDVPLRLVLYKPLLDLFFKYFDPIEDPNVLLFDVKRGWIFKLCKLYFGDDYFPHWFRHYVASFDARKGCPIPVMQTKMGWSHMNSAKPYLHLDSTSVSNFQLQIKRENYTVKAGASGEVVINKQPPERIVIVKHKNSSAKVENVKKTLPVTPKNPKKEVVF